MDPRGPAAERPGGRVAGLAFGSVKQRGTILEAWARLDLALARLVDAVREEVTWHRDLAAWWRGERRTYIGCQSNEEIDAEESARARGDG